MLDTQYRKLAIKSFDGKELYHGVKSRFLERRKELNRQDGFAESVCFVRREDIKTNVLGQHQAEKAHTYCRQRRWRLSNWKNDLKACDADDFT